MAALPSVTLTPLDGSLDWICWGEPVPDRRHPRTTCHVAAIDPATRSVHFTLTLSKQHQTQYDAEAVCAALQRIYRS